MQVLERHAARIPWSEVGARVFALNELNDALSDAAAYRIPKALVAPQLRASC